MLNKNDDLNFMYAIYNLHDSLNIYFKKYYPIGCEVINSFITYWWDV